MARHIGKRREERYECERSTVLGWAGDGGMADQADIENIDRLPFPRNARVKRRRDAASLRRTHYSSRSQGILARQGEGLAGWGRRGALQTGALRHWEVPSVGFVAAAEATATTAPWPMALRVSNGEGNTTCGQREMMEDPDQTWIDFYSRQNSSQKI
jgi:hypothetical protein